MYDYKRLFPVVVLLKYKKQGTSEDDETTDTDDDIEDIEPSTDNIEGITEEEKYCDTYYNPLMSQPLPHLVGKGVELSAFRYPHVLRKYQSYYSE